MRIIREEQELVESPIIEQTRKLGRGRQEHTPSGSASNTDNALKVQELAGKQYQLGTKLNNLQENYRKTGLTKRTKEYQAKKIDELTQIGAEYQAVQERLRDILPEGEDDQVQFWDSYEEFLNLLNRVKPTGISATGRQAKRLPSTVTPNITNIGEQQHLLPAVQRENQEFFFIKGESNS